MTGGESNDVYLVEVNYVGGCFWLHGVMFFL